MGLSLQAEGVLNAAEGLGGAVSTTVGLDQSPCNGCEEAISDTGLGKKFVSFDREKAT